MAYKNARFFLSGYVVVCDPNWYLYLLHENEKQYSRTICVKAIYFLQSAILSLLHFQIPTTCGLEKQFLRSLGPFIQQSNIFINAFVFGSQSRDTFLERHVKNQSIHYYLHYLSVRWAKEGGQRGGPAPIFGSCENKCIFN